MYAFNPFIENLDKVSGLVSGIQFVGVIRNADLNPGFPTSTPEVNQAWLIADNNGTVGGEAVSIGDILLYTSTGWEIIANGTVTIPLATEIVYGTIRIATISETQAGSIDNAAITPLKLFNYLQTTDFGNALVPQLFSKLLSDGSVVITDNTTSIQISLPLIGSSGAYGSASDTLSLITDDRGRVTSITTNPIVISSSQVSDLATYITNNFSTLITSTTLDISGTNIELPYITTAGTYGNASNFPIITVDAHGRVTSITTTSITGNPNFVEDVQDIIGTSLNSTTLNISYDDSSGFTNIEIPNTSVTPSTYGSASQTPVFTVNSQGRLIAASNVNINIVTSQISDFTTAVRNILSASVGNTSNVALTWNPTTNQILADLTNIGVLGTYGSGTQIPVITTDVKGRVTNVGLVNINWSAATINSSQIVDFVEAAQDAVGSSLTDSSEIDFTYNDTFNQITAVLKPSGVTVGTYTKLTVDSKGRVTSGTFLSSSDIPVHNHDGSHITTGIINVARLGVNPQPNTFLRGDGQFTTVTPSFGNQTPNTVFAGPTTAPSDQPLFRALVNNDLPISPVTPGTYGTASLIPVITVNDRGIVTGITTAPITAPNLVWGGITGNILDQLDLVNLLSNYQTTSQKGQPNGYASLDSSGRLPASQLTVHTHNIADVLGLQVALDNKADISHTHVSTDITDFQESVQDVIGSTLVQGTGISINYNDVTGQVLIENTQPPVDPETIQDTVGQLFNAGTHQGILFTYDDANNRMNTDITANLQKVTDNGASTTNPISITGASSYISISNNTLLANEPTKNSSIKPGLYESQLMSGNYDKISIAPNQIVFQTNPSNSLTLNLSTLSGTNTQTFQNSSGTIALLNDIPTSVTSFSDFNESVDDRVSGLLQAGTGINLSYNDTSNTLTISTNNAILQNGNSFGTSVVIGSNDNQSLILETNNQNRLIISNTGAVTVNNLSGTGNRIVVANPSGQLSTGVDVSTITPNTRTINTTGGIQGGGNLSVDRTLSLTDTGVIPDTYTYPTITVDAKGRITSAVNGDPPILTTTSLTPQVYSGGNYVSAQANNQNNVADVLLLSNGIRIDSGRIQWTGHGLVVGDYYILSQTNPGQFTNIIPTSGLIQRLFFVESPNIVLVNVEPAFEAGTSSSSISVFDEGNFIGNVNSIDFIGSGVNTTINTALSRAVVQIGSLTPPSIVGSIVARTWDGFSGTGVDGDVTISGNVTLSKDMHYKNLTITSTGILQPNGFRIFVSENLIVNGVIRRNGANGATASSAPLSAHSVPNLRYSQDEPGIVSNTSSANSNPSVAGNGGSIVNYNSTSLSANGFTHIVLNPQSPSVTWPNELNGEINNAAWLLGINNKLYYSQMSFNFSSSNLIRGGSPGSVGSIHKQGFSTPNPTTTLRNWGGQGGGVIRIYANNITGTGSIEAIGGNGVDGFIHTEGSNNYPFSGSGGGGGGTIFIGTNNISSTLNISVAGGVGGSGANVYGSAGLNGSSGRIFIMTT